MKNKKELTISLHPNPFNETLTIEANDVQCIPFQILNSSGKVMHEGFLSEKTTINTTSFPVDTYFFKYTHKRKNTIIKTYKGTEIKIKL